MTPNRRTFIKLLAPSLAALALSMRTEAQTGRAPEFSLPETGGNTVALSSARGKVVLLNFWATWCGPCITEIPHLNELHLKYGPQGLQVLSVALQSGSAKKIQAESVKREIKYPVLIGTDGIANKYKVFAYPTTFLIDPDGNIRRKYTGGLSGKTPTARTLESEIQALLHSS